jgi:hypothetical protein
MIDGNKDDLHMRRAKIQRLKVSLKLLDYNPKRDFAGWGGEDFRRLSGMPGFTHYSALTRVDTMMFGISSADFNGDGKSDLVLAGPSRVALLANGGESPNDVSLPGLTGGCRAAVWADSQRRQQARPGLPPRPVRNSTPARPTASVTIRTSCRSRWVTNLTAAAGSTPMAMAGRRARQRLPRLRLYRNRGKADPLPAGFKLGQPVPDGSRWFEDVSTQMGLGADGRLRRPRATRRGLRRQRRRSARLSAWPGSGCWC